MLPACLAAAAPAVDEIVVVDTGSSDATIEIARAHGARVIEHPWNGSFAEARNVSLDAATGDWLIYLDADEVLVEADTERLRALRGHSWREAFYLVETNHTGDLDDGTAVTHNALRMFRNRPEYRFTGRLHEQVAHAMPGDLAERFEHTGVRVEHYGYLGVVRDAKEKSRRNIELLERQAAEGRRDPVPRLQPRLRVRRRRRRSGRAGPVPARLGRAARRGRPRQARLRPVAVESPDQGAARQRPAGGRRGAGRRGPGAVRRLHRPRLRAGRLRARPRRRRRRPRAVRALPGDGRRAERATPPPSAAAATSRSRSSPSCPSRPRPPSCWPTASSATPPTSARCCRSRTALLARGDAAGRRDRAGRGTGRRA